nr:AraC family transcriptional regulator [Lentibacter algarum]
MLRVLDYILANPDGDLSLDNLADVAALSRFHWHRVFHAMTGETCAEAVRRIRLRKASFDLVQTDQSIKTIAASVGYPNMQSFARAFRGAFSQTPHAYRQAGHVALPKLKFKRKENEMFDVTLAEMPERKIIGLPHKGAYNRISEAYEKVFALVGSRGMFPQTGKMVALYESDPTSTPEAELSSFAGIEYSGDAQEGFEVRTLTAGPAAKLRLIGPYTGLQAAYDHLYGVWLPQSGRVPAEVPSFEVYENSPHDTAPQDLITDIYLPLA